MYFKRFDQIIWTGHPEMFLRHCIFTIFSKVNIANGFESKTCLVKPEEVFSGYSELFDQQFSGIFLCYLPISANPSWKFLHHTDHREVTLDDSEARRIKAQTSLGSAVTS